jgi:hypothetical protein
VNVIGSKIETFTSRVVESTTKLYTDAFFSVDDYAKKDDHNLYFRVKDGFFSKLLLNRFSFETKLTLKPKNGPEEVLMDTRNKMSMMSEGSEVEEEKTYCNEINKIITPVGKISSYFNISNMSEIPRVGMVKVDTIIQERVNGLFDTRIRELREELKRATEARLAREEAARLAAEAAARRRSSSSPRYWDGSRYTNTNPNYTSPISSPVSSPADTWLSNPRFN